MEMIAQKAEERTLKLHQVIERQKHDVQRLQVDYDSALHKIKKLGDESKKQERRYLLALDKKQQTIDHEVEEKRKLQNIVIEMGKRQGEKIDETMDVVGMTIRRRTRPLSASSTRSRLSLRGKRSPSSPISPVSVDHDVDESTRISLRPNSATTRGGNSSHGHDRNRPRSAVSSRTNSRGSLSPYVLGVKRTHEDELVSEISALKKEVRDKMVELNAKNDVVSQLQYSIQMLHNDLDAANIAKVTAENDVDKRLGIIRRKAQKQLQYQRAKCSALEAKIKKMEGQLSRPLSAQPVPKPAWKTPKVESTQSKVVEKLETVAPSTALKTENINDLLPQTRSPVQWAQSVQ